MLWEFLFGRSRPAPPKRPVGRTIRLGMLEIPERDAMNHLLALGTTGSGKTVVQRLVMQDVLPDITEGGDRRALVYDAKGDAMPLLAGIVPGVEVVSLNPFDARGYAWDLARDVTEPRLAVEMAFTLIPREHESQPFFGDSSRHLIYAVMLGFLMRGYDWSLADVLRMVQHGGRLKRFLQGHRTTRSVVSRYFGDPRLLSNIYSTIASKLLPFECVAACWESADQKIAMRDWVVSSKILVLGNAEESRQPIDALNRSVFRRIVQLVLRQSESRTRRTWFFLDELSEAGKLDALIPLCKKGRSKGAVVMICCQSLAGLRDEKLYGPHYAEELMAQIGNRFYGRLECPDSAEAASRLFGDQEIDQYTKSTTYSEKNSTTWAQQIVTRRAVLPSEFLNIEPCSMETGLTGFYRTRFYGCSHGTLEGEYLFNQALIPPDGNVEEFLDRPLKSHILRGWTKAEQKRLGVDRLDKPAEGGPAPTPSPSPSAETPQPDTQTQLDAIEDYFGDSPDAPDAAPKQYRLDGIDGLFN